eukprot:COSAG04_NODE_19550_length_413_cov_1.385350_2_plen_68_part_01
MAATVGKPDRTPADPPPTFTRITQAFDDTKLEVETELPAAVKVRSACSPLARVAPSSPPSAPRSRSSP